MKYRTLSMINKIDEGLSGVNEFFKAITKRITPNWILLVTLLNGFFLGLITTGFLGDRSVSVYSFVSYYLYGNFCHLCVFKLSCEL